MTQEELLALAEKYRAERTGVEHEIHVCTGTGCLSAQSDKVKTAIEAEVDRRGKK